MAGLGSAAVSELLTQQSVMSQLLGRCGFVDCIFFCSCPSLCL